MMSERTEFAEDDLLPISALQHFIFCERQAALIHIEGLWRENPLTIEGSHLHRLVDSSAPRREMRGDTVILRGLALRSLRFGLVGRADVVELRRHEEISRNAGRVGFPSATSIHGLKGLWSPFPIEYKRGKPKFDSCDEVQLCAQALCLEEMLEVVIPGGALFYGSQQHRHPVTFDECLRLETKRTAEQFRSIVASGHTPRVKKTVKCKNCSLVEICLPGATGSRRSARHYLSMAVQASLKENESLP